MRILLCIGVLLFVFGLYIPAQAGLAPPPLWAPDFGTELTNFSDCDDGEEAINFPVNIPL